MSQKKSPVQTMYEPKFFTKEIQVTKSKIICFSVWMQALFVHLCSLSFPQPHMRCFHLLIECVGELEYQ